MKYNTSSLCKIALLALVTTQFDSNVVAAPLEERHENSLQARACSIPLRLGTAMPWAMLAVTGISNTGNPLSITGNIGVTPAGAVTGIVAADVTGTININNPAASSAMAVASNICACASGLTPAQQPYADISGRTFAPGVYSFSAAGVNLGALSTVTLDGASNPKGQWIFKIDTTLTTGAFATVRLINGAQACNVFWVVGSSATLGASTAFEGNICALTSITGGAAVKVNGLMVARNAAISIAGGTFKALTTCSN